MKNLQKFAVALLVGIMAIGFSAFTSIKPTTTQVKNLRAIPAGFLVQTSNGVYEYRSSLSPDATCAGVADNPCHYQVSDSNNLPQQSTYSTTDIETYSGISNPVGDDKLWVE